MITINNKSNCTGCSACYSVCSHSAIEMRPDNEGFLYPSVIQDKCVNCGLCDTVCPIPKRDGIKDSYNVLDGYVAHYRGDDSVWYKSSSGGAFTAITDYVFNKGGIVYGATYNDVFAVIHERANNKEEAIKFRGSKYVQSNLRDCFKEIRSLLRDNQNVLFSGTPCQVAGLKSFLGRDYENLLTVDLICHCVPSPRVFQDYIRFIQDKYQKRITQINMKDKTLGWNTFQTPRIYFEDGSSIFNIEDSRLWETIFYSHIAIRPSCHSCRFSTLNRVGDITIGDYWGVEKNHPQFNNVNGASIVLVNSEKGRSAFPDISSHLKYEETDVVSALPDSLVYSTTPHPYRDHFWKDYDNHSFGKMIELYYGVGLKNRLRRKLHFLFNGFLNH